MIVADFVKISSETLKLLSKYDIKVDDYKFVDLFQEYEQMLAERNKVSYIVTVLSVKYGISETSIYRILKRFKATF